jgi:Flp pilus assembly protein TadG
MMRKLDQRGVAALEFCLVTIPLFFLMFAIFDLGRYAITMHSLRMLANASGRAWMICYQNDVIQSQPFTNCTANALMPTSSQNTIAPMLFIGGLTPTLNIPATTTSPLTVTASQPGFTMVMPIWGTAFNAPSASTSVPF